MTKEEYEKLYIKLNEYVKANLTEHRYNHCLGVEKAAVKYALKYGADPDKARIAGIFHDACKGTAGLNHGEQAAILIKEKFGVDDEDILMAIANHTIGRINSSTLEKVMKLADLLEEGRSYEDAPMIRAFEEKSDNIDETYLLLLERQREVLIAKGIDYDKRTDTLIDFYRKELHK